MNRQSASVRGGQTFNPALACTIARNDPVAVNVSEIHRKIAVPFKFDPLLQDIISIDLCRDRRITGGPVVDDDRLLFAPCPRLVTVNFVWQLPDKMSEDLIIPEPIGISVYDKITLMAWMTTLLKTNSFLAALLLSVGPISLLRAEPCGCPKNRSPNGPRFTLLSADTYRCGIQQLSCPG